MWRICTGLSWACKMVSKLNVKPFHKVNSPLLAPAILRFQAEISNTKTKEKKSMNSEPSSTCYQPTALRGPGEAKDGASHLVCCSLDKPCGHCIDWAVLKILWRRRFQVKQYGVKRMLIILYRERVSKMFLLIPEVVQCQGRNRCLVESLVCLCNLAPIPGQ